MNDFLSGNKKIITMILGIVSGLAISFGLDQSEVSAVAGAVVAVGSVISYMVAEGRIDVERIRNAADAVNDVIDIMDLDDLLDEFTDDVEGGEPDEQAESN